MTTVECESLHRRSGVSWLGGKMWQGAWLERDRGGDAASKFRDAENDCGTTWRIMKMEDQDGGRLG